MNNGRRWEEDCCDLDLEIRIFHLILESDIHRRKKKKKKLRQNSTNGPRFIRTRRCVEESNTRMKLER